MFVLRVHCLWEGMGSLSLFKKKSYKCTTLDIQIEDAPTPTPQ